MESVGFDLSLSEAHDLRTVCTVSSSPTWANGGFGEYDIPPYHSTNWHIWLAGFENFVTAAVTRYADRQVLWELWNEPNLDGFWNGTKGGANATEYLAWHNAIRAAIFAVDPHARIAAPTLSTWRYVGASDIAGDVFLARLISGGIVLDACSFHVYDDDAPNDSLTQYVNHHTDVVLLREALVGYGLDNIPIWFTEFGWDASTSGEATQASYLTTAFTMIQGWPYVEIATWFMQEDSGSYRDGVYEGPGSSYAPRKARDAFAAFIAGL